MSLPLPTRRDDDTGGKGRFLSGRRLLWSNLYRFAGLFRDRLSCPDALYLDGQISEIYVRDLTGPIEQTNSFAGILAITEPLP